jgi:AbrB family looped-hinge helix DNA binding protein
MKNDILTTIDHAGRIVIPKSLRVQAALEPGTRLRIRLREGVVEIEPAPRSVSIRRRGSILVAEPKDESPSLTAAEVRQTLETTRRRNDHG